LRAVGYSFFISNWFDVTHVPCVNSFFFKFFFFSLRYNRYEVERVVSFIPPDGSFKLMNYRVAFPGSPPALPVVVRPQIFFSENSGRLDVTVNSRNVPGKVVENVVINIPLPAAVASAQVHANVGTFTFDPITKVRLSEELVEREQLASPFVCIGIARGLSDSFVFTLLTAFAMGDQQDTQGRHSHDFGDAFPDPAVSFPPRSGLFRSSSPLFSH
jgi:hypothetical protein